MIEPEFDADGYPTEATLEALSKWMDAAGALAFMARAWHFGDWGVSKELRPEEAVTIHADKDAVYWRFATGGWSGNEDLVNAFMKSPAAMVSWCLHGRGGLWIFEERHFER